MRALRVTAEQVRDTSRGFCLACGTMFRGKQSEHVTTDAHVSAVNTWDRHMAKYQGDGRDGGTAADRVRFEHEQTEHAASIREYLAARNAPDAAEQWIAQHPEIAAANKAAAA